MGRLSPIITLSLRRGAGDLRATLEMIQFEHTLFALPFAMMGAVLAAGGIPDVPTLVGILLAMVGARSAAMTFNRLADHSFDALNPRTAGRPLVTGALSRKFAWGFLLFSCLLFLGAAAMLNRLAFALAFPVLALLLGYSYAKRFTSAAHFLLGASLGCAPLGAWIAVRGRIDAAPLLLGVAVLLWTAGFDILYACQDCEFDRKVGLHSIPRRWGIGTALRIARFLHALMPLALFGVGRLLSRGPIYYSGVLAIAALLVYEHSLVHADDLSRVNRAFFAVNGWISALLFLTTLADLIWPL